ncbi:2-nitropropane dioxygenase [Amycolatopsis coloradensis]|uniref:2-nitropropane dioxygenase n=1 Tax=Amycolatopsis coloradensis TaxID=76021 RepID=A0A1R0KTW4_9PSEU|nr:PfaD family polyunsaturated fatty acid/polyketide biosynthesis protein [Amycolatopsis coloradensis]OLZ51472.1 2-nitropropane dioxygenase [Amycolatopsis coloradensis]
MHAHAPSTSARQDNPAGEAPAFDPVGIADCVRRPRTALHVVDGGPDRGHGVLVGDHTPAGLPVVGTLPPLYPEWLGDRSFCTDHGVRFPYVAGEMANGIATVRMVTALAEADLLAVFGAGGLGLGSIERAVGELGTALGGRANWGVNLIHAPGEPLLEERTADLLIGRGVPLISASAYLTLTPAVVRCAVAGLHRDHTGRIVRARRILVKLSRPEVARQFLSPAPREVLRELIGRGQITQEEAELAASVPLADDVTAEADSGGHTDNRPLTALLPAVLGLRDELTRQHGYRRAIRVGAAGGLGTPAAVAAAFAAGAAYVVTGSVNQASVEAGLSDQAKALLAEADLADVVMAPAADMFEMGVKLQVLRRGTMFASRAGKLYDAYRDYPSLEALPAELRAKFERDVFRLPVDEVWRQTRRFWQDRDPAQLSRAENDPRHRMALVFRWYLGQSSRWAISGEPSRTADYQIWCGPAMGAFNRWVAGSFLAAPRNRTVAQIALNLLEGATVLTRAHQLRTFGVPVPPEASVFVPQPLS